MPRSKPIPPEVPVTHLTWQIPPMLTLLQVIHHSRLGDIDAIRRLERLLEARNTTSEIVEVVFGCLAAYPVPVISTQASRHILKTVVGARPSAYLRALWKIISFGTAELPDDVQTVMVQHLRQSGDTVFSWARLCLQNDLPCVPEDKEAHGSSARRHAYLYQARMLQVLLRLDGGLDGTYAKIMLSSPALVDLLLELWLAEERRDRTGTLVCRMVDVKAPLGCNIIDLANRVLSDEHREVFLTRCNGLGKCTQFSQALVDRVVHGWDQSSIPIMGWVRSLCDLTSISFRLCNAHRYFRRSLSQMGFLTILSSHLEDAAKGISEKEEMRFLAYQIIPALKTLLQLSQTDTTPSRIRNNWERLKSGRFLDAVVHCALLLQGDGHYEDEIAGVLSIFHDMRRYASLPRLFGDTKLPDLPVEGLARCPSLVQPWSTLVVAHGRVHRARSALESRPAVYFCDYVLCAIRRSGIELASVPKQGEIGMNIISTNARTHGKSMKRRASHTWYTHDLRAEQAALLEAIYANMAENMRGEPGTILSFDCRSMDISAKWCTIESAWDVSNNDGSYSKHLQHRYDALFHACQANSFPSDWRLAECLFPPLGGEASIRMISLLKPVEEGYRTMHCIANYSYLDSTLPDETVHCRNLL
ncbi:hypothetical protein NMY22_g13237 [Coprinellus aureogranulatus]|nr:hypothetical protein NMY22_g13237 [Coprinellus aureogranulatus]